MALVSITLSRTFPLPGLALTITTAVYWLVLAGLVTLTLTEEPLKVGHGLFTVLSGFGLYYATLESSLLLTGLWGSVNLLLALAIGYLTVVKGTGPEGGVQNFWKAQGGRGIGGTTPTPPGPPNTSDTSGPEERA